MLQALDSFQVGARSVLKGLMKKADKRRSLLALIFSNEAEGARTLNLRIDSPIDGFVSICGKRITGKLNT
jgi:hypothetical protein